MQKVMPTNAIIIRTSWVYSEYGNNFVKTMLKLAETRDEISVVADQIGSPTNAADLAKVILAILPKIQNKNVEVFHYSNEGNCSWFDFAKAIFEKNDILVKVIPIKSSSYQTIADRPFYSVLDKNKIKHIYGVQIPNWRKSFID